MVHSFLSTNRTAMSSVKLEVLLQAKIPTLDVALMTYLSLERTIIR